jgi:uncharacterized membrane protein
VKWLIGVIELHQAQAQMEANHQAETARKAGSRLARAWRAWQGRE